MKTIISSQLFCSSSRFDGQIQYIFLTKKLKEEVIL